MTADPIVLAARLLTSANYTVDLSARILPLTCTAGTVDLGGEPTAGGSNGSLKVTPTRRPRLTA